MIDVLLLIGAVVCATNVAVVWEENVSIPIGIFIVVINVFAAFAAAATLFYDLVRFGFGL